MTVLSIPDPLGVGTLAVESLHSLLQRTANSYRVSMRTLLRLAAVDPHEGRIYKRSFNVPSDVLGVNVTATRLIDGCEILSSRKDLRSTSLAGLRAVIGHGSGLFALRFRFCPDCADPARGLGYGMLAHQLLYVGHCPIHGTALIECCLSCTLPISISQDVYRGPICPRCGDRLWTQRVIPPTRSSTFLWRESQVLMLMQFATADSFVLDLPNWAHEFRSELQLLSTNAQGYDVIERTMIKESAKRAIPHPLRSTVDELLRLAMIQACDVTDIIQRPKESLSPRLPHFQRAAAFRVQRPRKKRSIWLEVKKMLVELMHTDQMFLLPSKRLLLKDSGLSVSGISQHFGHLAIDYENERKRRTQLHRDSMECQALEIAFKFVRRASADGTALNIRRTAKEVIRESGVSKNLAERLVSGAQNLSRILSRIAEAQDEMRFSH